MKFNTFQNSKIMVIPVILLFMTNCSPPVTFDQPQPPNTKELAEFPKRLQGIYLSQGSVSESHDNVSVLTISGKSAIRTYDFELRIPMDSINIKYRLQNDTLTETATNLKIPAIVAGDTVLAKNHGIDTMFCISATNVLKKFRGYYFLNALYDKNAWTVQRLSLSKGILTISEIADSTHLNQLKEITETPNDTICSNFKLNQAQFKKFVKENGFDQSEQFTRLSGK